MKPPPSINKRFRHDLKPSFTSSGFFLTWDFTTNPATQTHREIPVFRFTSGKKDLHGGCSLPTWSCNPPKKKKHYVFEANAIETSDTVVLLSCSHFFRVYNQPICLPVALKHQSHNAHPPSSPWSPYVHPSGIPIKIPFFLFITKEPSEPPGWFKKWQIVRGLLIGSLLGRCHLPIFCNSRWFRMMLWNDPIYTFDKKNGRPDHPPRKYHVNIRVRQRKKLVQDVQVWMLKFKMISLFTQFPARTKTRQFRDEKWGFWGNVLVPLYLFWWDFWPRTMTTISTTQKSNIAISNTYVISHLVVLVEVSIIWAFWKSCVAHLGSQRSCQNKLEVCPPNPPMYIQIYTYMYVHINTHAHT